MATDNPLLDQLSKLLTNAAGAAKGMRDELGTLIKTQTERIVNDLNLVPREEFDAMKSMHAKSRKEVEELRARLAVLEIACAKNDSRDSRLLNTSRNKPLRSHTPKHR